MATESIAIVVNSPPASTLTFTAAGPLTAPLAANTPIGTINIEPAGWEGALVLSGADEASFSLSAPVNGQSELLNTVPLSAKTYAVVVSAAP